MSKIFLFLAKAFGCFASIELLYVYGYSIYTTAKASSFCEMVLMLILPPFSQIYLFISRWCEFGFYNKFGISCCLFLIETLAALIFAGLGSAACKEWPKTRCGRIVYYLVSIFAIVALCFAVSGLYTSKPSKHSHTVVDKVLGISFGDTVDPGQKVLYTDAISEGYEFHPTQSFRSYDHYVYLASKKSHVIFCIRAEKDFETADEADKEVAILKLVLAEKYEVRFIQTDNGYVAKIGSDPDSGTVIIIAKGKDDSNKHIVIFSIMDIPLTTTASEEAGVNESDIRESVKAL